MSWMLNSRLVRRGWLDEICYIVRNNSMRFVQHGKVSISTVYEEFLT